MFSVATLSKFACDRCGSISVILPSELNDSAFVRCGGCGRDYGCWAQFKQEVDRIISAEHRPMAGSEHPDLDSFLESASQDSRHR